MADALPLLAAALEGRYRFEPAQADGSPILGQGGMAVVYAARDLKLGREVALKVFREELGQLIGPDRFLREIRIAAALSHPHILPLYDSGSAAGHLYYVMPRVRGETLRQRLDRERVLPVEQAVGIAREVADALDYAHRADVIHRDIKPENILLADGHALVADFGVARSISGRERYQEAGASATGTGLAVGTLAYMSPEQRAGAREIDGRSDLFSLGSVLFEMLTGDTPALPSGARHDGARSDPVIEALHVARPGLPQTFDPVLQRALAARPDDRFPTAAAMAEALGHLGFHRRLALSRLPVLLSVAALLVLAVGLGYRWWRDTFPAVRPVVLVAGFTGPATDPLLGHTIAELVTAELDQSTRLTTVPPEQLHAARLAAGLPDSTMLGLELARQLATRLSVRAVVTGSVQPVGSGAYALILRAVEPGSGRDLAVFSSAASDSDLVVRAGALARRIRSALGERERELRQTRPVWDVTTRSFPAYQKYVLALQQFNRGRVAATITLLHEAIGLDSGFAAAWADLGTSYFYQRQPDSMVAAFLMARRYQNQLSDLKRYRLQADISYAVDGDLAGAIHWYDLALQLVPTCVPAHNNRGLYLASLGRYDEALRDITRAAELSSFGEYQGQAERLNQAATLVILGRLPEARAVVPLLRPPYAAFIDLMLPVATGNWARAESTAQMLQDSPLALELVRDQARLTQAAAQAARGKIDAARATLHRLGIRSPRELREAARSELLLCAAAGCRLGPLPPSLAGDSTPAGRVTRGTWQALSGDTIRANADLAELDRLDSIARRRIGPGREMLAASLAARGERWGEVTTRLAPAARLGEHNVLDPDRISTQAMRWLVAQAYEQQGRVDSAVAYYTLLTRPERIPAWSFALQGLVASAARHHLAILTAAEGANAESARWQEELRQSLDRPDPAYRGWVESPTARDAAPAAVP